MNMLLIHSSWIIFIIVTASACSNNNFRPGNEYLYKYEVTIDGSAVGTTNRKTGLDIKCEVRVVAEEKCHFMLHVDECKLSELGEPSEDGVSQLVKNAKSDHLSLELSKYPAYFGISNGTVETLSFHNEDSLISTNFKRGIITSALTGRRRITKSEKDANLPSYEYSVDDEVRDDVQGSCAVKYIYKENTDSHKMIKDMKTCTYPSKPDWRYSPYSLFWNMSFIQTLWINSSAHCQYDIPYENGHLLLKNTVCKERHAIHLESTKDTEISVQTNIIQKLILKDHKSTKEWKEMPEDVYHPSSIHFEYEATSVPKSNQADVENKIKQLSKEVAIDLEAPEEKDRTSSFGELIDLLRVTPDLDKLSQEIVELTNSKESTNSISTTAHRIQIFRDALLQCHRTHCLKYFRRLFDLSEPYLSLVLSDDYLQTAFDTLSHSETEDTTYIKEINGFCKARPNMTQCDLALMSVVRSLWDERKKEWTDITKVPSDIIEVLDYLSTLPNLHNKEDDIDFYYDTNIQHIFIVKMQIIGTLGELLELHKPDILDILFQREVTDLDRVLRIEATRNFKASDALYEKLVGILKSEKHLQEERVASYLVLVDKFPDEKLSTELQKGFDSNATDYNLKTFIFSHLFALSRSTDYAKAKFARNLVHYISINKNFGVNDSLYPIAGDGNSEFKEYNYWSSLPFLSSINNQIGLKIKDTKLFNGADPDLFFLRKNLTLLMFGKEFDLFEGSLYMEGLKITRNQVYRLGDTHPLNYLLRNYIKKPSQLRYATTTWPYELDSLIAERLKDIRKTITDKRNPKMIWDFLLSLREFGDDSGFVTANSFRDFLSKPQQEFYRPGIKGSLAVTPASKNVKFVEALNLIPTLSGIPLNWTTDAYYLSKSEKLNTAPKNDKTRHFDYRFGITASLRNRMLVDIPGYTDCGVQSLSSANLAFNGQIEYNSKETILSIGLLQQPAYISLDRKNFLIRGYALEHIPDHDVERVKQEWCSDALVPSVGLQLCHSRSYPAVTDRSDKPWTLMAGDSHWKYTLKNVNKERTLLSFKIDRGLDKKGPYFKVLFENSNKKEAAKEIFSYHSDDKIREIHVGVRSDDAPHASFTLDPKKSLVAKLSYGTENKYEVKFQIKMLREVVPEGSLKNRFLKADGTRKVVKTGEQWNTTVTTPTKEIFSYIHEFSEWPFAGEEKAVVKYSCGLPCNSWLKGILPTELWDEDGNAVVEYHHRNDRDNRVSFDNFRLESSNQLKTPKTVYEFRRTNVYHTGVENMCHMNFSKYSLTDNERLTYLNVSFGIRSDHDDNSNSTEHLVTLSVPQSSFYAGLKNKARQGQQSTHFALLRVPNDDLPGSKSKTAVSAIKQTGIKLDLIYKDRSPPERPQWSNYKSNMDISYDFPGLDTQHLVYTDQMITTEPYDWTHEFEVKGTQFPVTLNSETTFRLKSDRLINGQLSKVTGANGELLASQNAYMWRVFKEPVNVYHLNYSLWTDYGDVSLNLVTGTEECQKKNGYGSLNFDIRSPVVPAVNTGIKSRACNGDSFLEASVKNTVLDIAIKGLREKEKGIATITADFKVKKGFELAMHDRTVQLEYPESFPIKPVAIIVNNLHSKQILYGLFQYYADLSQYIVTACLQERCTDYKSNPKSFIVQTVYDYHDKDLAVHTVTLNPELSHTSETRLISILLSADTTVSGLEDALVDRSPPLTGISEPPPSHLWNSIREFLEPIFDVGRRLKRYDEWQSIPFTRALAYTHIPWFWKYFNGTEKATKYLIHKINVFTPTLYEIENTKRYENNNMRYFMTRPGTTWPYLRPEIYRTLWINLDITEEHFKFRDIFYEHKYDRYAVLFDNNDVMTFDGTVVRNVSSTFKQCPFLLTTDVRFNRFSIYVQNDDLHFLFPEVHLRISKNGDVIKEPKGASFALPYSDENSTVIVKRRENVLSIHTDYNLDVKCVVGLEFCLFYTSDATYGDLAGLLGNNNHNPADDVQPLARWNLSKESSCGNAVTKKAKKTTAHWWQVLPNPYNSDSLYQCMDIVDPYEFTRQGEKSGSDPCAIGAAYLAFCAAHNVDVLKAFPQCFNCQGHPVGDSWKQHVDKNVEIVFVIDDSDVELNKKDFVKSVQTLATVITKEFAANEFNSTKIGLMGSSGCRRLTANGKLFYTADELASGMTFEPNSNEPSTSSIELALLDASSYPFDVKAAHIIVLVTEDDSKDVYDPEQLNGIHEKFESKNIAFYTIASYPESSKQSKLVGIRGDGYAFPQPKNKELFVDFPKGLCAKLSSATRGAVWFLSNLVSKSPTTKVFMQTMSEELVARAKQDTRQCRRCRCTAPDYYEPLTKCRVVEC